MLIYLPTGLALLLLSVSLFSNYQDEINRAMTPNTDPYKPTL